VRRNAFAARDARARRPGAPNRDANLRRARISRRRSVGTRTDTSPSRSEPRFMLPARARVRRAPCGSPDGSGRPR
jgi:hypothetical protein